MRHLHFVLIVSVIAVFCSCCSANHAAQGTISVGMTRTETLQRLRQSGAVEVAKDVAAGKGWSVANRHECLFLSFTNDVLASIGVETRANEAKMYRGGYATNIYRLR